MALKFNVLTRNAAKALKPGERIQEHGIIAEGLASGDVRWTVNVMVDGARHHRVVGNLSAGVTRQQAEHFIAALRTKAREDRLDLPKGRKLQRSFAEAATGYLERMDATGGKDLKNKRRHLNAYLVPYLGNDRLDQISEHRLRQYRKSREGMGAKPATINRELATFSHLMRRASSKGWGWIKPDAVPEIPKEREARKQIHLLSAEQCAHLLKAAAEDDDDHIWLFVMFGLNAAMRHSEIMSRRFDEVDFDHARLWIDKAKAGEREQPLTESLRDALKVEKERRNNDEGWIFPALRSDAKTPHRRDMRAPFERCVKRAGIDPTQCTPHVLRHTAITRLVKAGVDLPTIKRISGHKTTAMVEHYTHIHGAHIDNAVSALDITTPVRITQKLHTDFTGPSDPKSAAA